MNDDRADWREAWALFPGDVAYVWHGGLHAGTVADSLHGHRLREAGPDHLEQERHGDRPRALPPQARAVLVRGPQGRQRPLGRRPEADHRLGHRARRSETGHGTQKPVEAMARPIRNNSKPGDRVYEPFSGSGTTIIAAQMNKRICHAIELIPAYVDVACQRFAEFTGVAPILAETGETFDQVRARRMAVV
jgi:hypothetical protein